MSLLEPATVWVGISRSEKRQQLRARKRPARALGLFLDEFVAGYGWLNLYEREALSIEEIRRRPIAEVQKHVDEVKAGLAQYRRAILLGRDWERWFPCGEKSCGTVDQFRWHVHED